MTWLLPCLLITAITAIAGLFFRNRFDSADQLAVFIMAFLFVPMIAAISRNTGLQTSAVVICGLATGDLAAMRIGQVFGREIRVAATVALLCGLCAFLIGDFLPSILPDRLDPHGPLQSRVTGSAGETLNSNLTPLPDTKQTVRQYHIAAALGTAMFSAIMVSTTLGLLLPFLLRRIGLDPAISSGPLVTTVNDFISIAIYMVLTFLAIR